MWDAGAKTTLLHRLEQAKEEGNQSLLGSYSSEELTLTLDIHAQDGLLWCYHPRYGSDPMMQIDNTHFIYWQERSSAFLVTLYPDGSLTLDAGRCVEHGIPKTISSLSKKDQQKISVSPFLQNHSALLNRKMLL